MSQNNEALLELYRRDFLTFRANLQVDGPGNRQWRMHDIEDSDQKADAAAMAPALQHICERGPMPDVRKFFIQRSRGRSKTTDIAIASLYVLFACKKKLTCVAVAEDKDQGKIVLDQLQKVLQHNPWLSQYVMVQRNKVINKTNDATLSFLARNTWSSFGLTPELVICDELTHWTLEGMYHSVSSSAAKVPHGVFIICCNAGYGADWKFKIKQEAIAGYGKSWYHNAPEGPAKWISKEEIEAQRRIMPYEEFARLWLNQWRAGSGEFVTMQEVEACVNPQRTRVARAPRDSLDYVAAVDYAEKHDRTVGVVGHAENGKIIVDRMDVIDPQLLPEGVCRLSWVENWMREVHREYARTRGHLEFVVDKWQMIGSIQKLRDEGYLITDFEFKSGLGNWEIAFILRQLILHQDIEWYPGCGEIRTPEGDVWRPQGRKDDLCTEIAELVVEKVGKSRWRFNHLPNNHDDRAFALGAMVRHLIVNCTGFEHWDLVAPTPDGKFQFNAT